MSSDHHAAQPVRHSGQALESATAVAVMLHGRGGQAEDILALSNHLELSEIAYVALQAAGNTWYPHSFLAPIDQNEPFLTSALAAVGSAVDQVVNAGIPLERVALLGFSQGACLAAEFAARNAQRYGALIVLSGGLIGPNGTPRDYPGSLAGTPAFLGCSDIDPHVPLTRVEESASALENLGGRVDLRIYQGMGHTINADELSATRDLLAALTAPQEPPAGSTNSPV